MFEKRKQMSLAENEDSIKYMILWKKITRLNMQETRVIKCDMLENFKQAYKSGNNNLSVNIRKEI